MTTTSTCSNGGITLAGALGLVFITLKLCHQIDWSWWWVLAPFWLPLALAVGLIVGAVVGFVIREAVRGLVRR